MRTITKRVQRLEQDQGISDDVVEIDICGDFKLYNIKPRYYTKTTHKNWNDLRQSILSDGMSAYYEDNKITSFIKEQYKSSDDEVYIPFVEYQEVFRDGFKRL